MSFQVKVAAWLRACFPDTASTPLVVRVDRFMEEAIELVQSLGYPRERVDVLLDYVYARPAGDDRQEVGGVLITLAALCETSALDMDACGRGELARVSTPEKMARLRAKNAGWSPDSPLPGGEHPVVHPSREGA